MVGTMTDLVKRAREWAEAFDSKSNSEMSVSEVALVCGEYLPDDLRKFADRIEQLEGELEQSNKSRSLLRQWLWNSFDVGQRQANRLAELEEEIQSFIKASPEDAERLAKKQARIEQLEADLRERENTIDTLERLYNGLSS
jgi:chromosome segregation ATPase